MRHVDANAAMAPMNTGTTFRSRFLRLFIPLGAVLVARENGYDLILMDMQMPKLNGVDATKAIRAGSLNRTTPILAMTANAFDEDRQVCLAAGMNDHIGKPVEPEQLFETLLKWLEKSHG